MKFTDLDLCSEIQSNLQKIGFTECTPVQEQTIPVILQGKDVSALAQTGTGKTAAFLLPLMERVWRAMRPEDPSAPAPTEAELEERARRQFLDWKKGHFILILVPTRELAEQVYQDFYKFRGELPFEAATIYGGTTYETQKSKLSQGVQFIVGTPGRLIDLYKTHSLDLRQVRAVVFDEADRMFDMGFKDDMKFLLQRMPKDRQLLLYSATLNFDVLTTAYKFGADPVEFNLSKDEVKAENVEDFIFHLGQEDKPKYLLSLIKKENPRQVMIFSNFKFNVERIAQFLKLNNIPALGISSLLTQAQRNRVIDQFKNNEEQNVLVATDVAARGLDIKNVDLVINFDLPDDPENYIHRIGRTGRAGATGKAYSFVSDRDVDALVRVENYLKHKLDVAWMEDADLVTEFKPIPSGERSDRPHRDHKRDDRSDRPRREFQRGGPRGSRDERHNSDCGPRREKPQENVHRDRISGRHGDSNVPSRSTASAPHKKTGPTQTKKPQHQHGRRNDHRKFEHKKGRTNTPPAKAGVLSKIKGFFSRLMK